MAVAAPPHAAPPPTLPASSSGVDLLLPLPVPTAPVPRERDRTRSETLKLLLTDEAFLDNAARLALQRSHRPIVFCS